MVNMRPCQGWDGSSILLTCSIDESVRTIWTLIYRKSIERLIFSLYKKLFNYNKIFKHYNPEVKEKERRISNLFNKKEINKSLKHINNKTKKSAKEFYTTKKDDDLSL